MKIFRIATIIAALALVLATYAYPSLSGAPGGLFTPQADYSLYPHMVEISVDHFLNGAAGTNAISSIRTVYALNSSTEVGILANINDNGLKLNRYGASISYKLPIIAHVTDRFAVSASYSAKSKNNNIGGLGLDDISQVSLVGSHSLRHEPIVVDPDALISPLVSVNYGVNLTRTTGSTIVRPFASLNMAYENIDVTTELQAKSTPFDKAVMAAITIRYPVTDSITVQGGFSNIVEGNFGGDRMYPFLGVKYSLTKKPVITVPNVPPTVYIGGIPDSDESIAPANVKINVIADDSDGTVTRVEFYNDNTLLATDTSFPYSFTWQNVAAGSYNLKVVAYDNENAMTTSEITKITVKDAGTNLR